MKSQKYNWPIHSVILSLLILASCSQPTTLVVHESQPPASASARLNQGTNAPPASASIQITKQIATEFPTETRDKTYTPPPQPEPSPTPYPASVSLPTQYLLRAMFDYPAHKLSVHEEITFTNQSSETLADVVIVIDAQRVEGGFQLVDLQIGSESSPTYSLAAGVLSAPLKAELDPGETLHIALNYDLKIKYGGSPSGFNEKQAYFGDWYPYLAAYTPRKGWVTHPASQVGETQVYPLANYDVYLKAGEDLLKFATSLPAETAGEWLHFHGEGRRNVSWAASPFFQLLEDSSGKMTYKVYTLPGDEDSGKEALRTIRQAYELFTTLYGPIHLNQLSVVEVGFFDGMEYDGLFFLSQDYFQQYRGNPMSYLTMLSAHEVAHQWWYASVANDQADEPWLDETLCIYSEVLFYQGEYPYLVDWWWAFRADRFEPQGWVNSSVYEFSSFRSYVNAVYLRGAYFMRELSRKIGEAKLKEFMKAYHLEMQGEIAQGRDFWRILAHFLSEVDIASLSKDYFH